jgi:phosphopantetheine adenylyltransferase
VDTRTKILRPEEAEALLRGLRDGGRALRVATGYFDPLAPAHVERLQRLAGEDSHLTVVVTDPPDPLLPLRARAELVASLAAVDAVVCLPADQLDGFLGRLAAAYIERGEAEDLRLRQELIRHVHSRQPAG